MNRYCKGDVVVDVRGKVKGKKRGQEKKEKRVWEMSRWRKKRRVAAASCLSLLGGRAGLLFGA